MNRPEYAVHAFRGYLIGKEDCARPGTAEAAIIREVRAAFEAFVEQFAPHETHIVMCRHCHTVKKALDAYRVPCGVGETQWNEYFCDEECFGEHYYPEQMVKHG